MSKKTKKREVVVMGEPQIEELLHELEHGAFLAFCLLERVGDASKDDECPSCYDRVYEEYPRIAKTYKAALAAVWKFYTEVGRGK